MKNSCGKAPGPKCLQCEFPPCNCEKCVTLRAQGKTDQRSLTPRCKGGYIGNNNHSREVDDKNSALKPDSDILAGFVSSLRIPKFTFTPSNLSSMLFDIVGIIAFFIMATFMFWITISIYLWRSLTIIYQMGRKTHIVAIVIFVLLVSCITFHTIQGRRMQACRSSNLTQTQNETISSSQSKCHNLEHSASSRKKQYSQHNLPSENKNAPQTSEKVTKVLSVTNERASRTDLNKNIKGQPCGKCGRYKAKKNAKSSKKSLCDLCAIAKKANRILTDEEVRDMYKLSKLYAIPTEMKSPPPSLVQIVDYLSNYYYGTTGSTGNTLPPINA